MVASGTLAHVFGLVKFGVFSRGSQVAQGTARLQAMDTVTPRQNFVNQALNELKTYIVSTTSV